MDYAAKKKVKMVDFMFMHILSLLLLCSVAIYLLN